MNEQEIMQEFKDARATLSGHFVLSSGLHSATYLQCARVLMDAARGERLCKALAAKINTSGMAFDAIVAPAMGGVVVGYEMGGQSLTLPLVSLMKLDIPTYKEEELPEALKNIPVEKPGSRFIKQKAS